MLSNLRNGLGVGAIVAALSEIELFLLTLNISFLLFHLTHQLLIQLLLPEPVAPHHLHQTQHVFLCFLLLGCFVFDSILYKPAPLVLSNQESSQMQLGNPLLTQSQSLRHSFKIT